MAKCQCGCGAECESSAFFLNVEVRSRRLFVCWPIPFASPACRSRWWAGPLRRLEPAFAASLHESDHAIALFVQHAAGTRYEDQEGYAFEDAHDLLAWWRGEEAKTVRCRRGPEGLTFLEEPPEHWVLGPDPEKK
jgi:hypothetical protein